jgi:hypothetical protein
VPRACPHSTGDASGTPNTTKCDAGSGGTDASTTRKPINPSPTSDQAALMASSFSRRHSCASRRAWPCGHPRWHLLRPTPRCHFAPSFPIPNSPLQSLAAPNLLLPRCSQAHRSQSPPSPLKCRRPARAPWRRRGRCTTRDIMSRRTCACQAAAGGGWSSMAVASCRRWAQCAGGTRSGPGGLDSPPRSEPIQPRWRRGRRQLLRPH